MKFQNIVVSGICNIVINRKQKWVRGGNEWHKAENIAHTYEHSFMMEIVQHLKADRRYRMWIHGDTLNIVRKEQTV